jgi:Arc/MetJ family transcription regulator
MVKRTTINLDMELVAQAREVLEAGNTTETVHAALRDVVRRDRLRRLSEWDLGGLTLEGLKEMRRSRVETKPWGKLVGDGSGIRKTLENARIAREARGAVASSEASPSRDKSPRGNATKKRRAAAR